MKERNSFIITMGSNLFQSRSSKRLLVLLLILMLLGAVGILYGSTSRYEGMYENLKNYDLSELKEKGNSYIKEHKGDSALACYIMITTRYNDRMKISDKRHVAEAYNNAGYVYTLMYSDYSLAYQYLLQSLKIAEENGYEEIKPYVYLNLGNIYLYYDDIKNAQMYYRMAYSKAKKWNIKKLLPTVYTNIVLNSPETEKRDSLESIISDYSKISLPPGEMVDFSRKISRMVTAYDKKDYVAAHQYLIAARNSVDAMMLPERYDNILDLWEGDLMLKLGDKEKALAILRKESEAETLGDKIGKLKFIANVYQTVGRKDSAAFYRMSAIELRDSLFRNQNYAQIRDMRSSYEIQEFKRNIEQIEERRRRNILIEVFLIIQVVVMSVFIVLLTKKNKRLKEALKDLYDKVRPADTVSSELPAFSRAEMDNEIYDSQIRVIDNVTQIEDVDSDVDSDSDISGQEERPKFRLDEDVCREISEKIDGVMKDKEIISQCEFTIRKLADITDIRERYLSYVLNYYMKTSFNNLLNERRISEARNILGNPESMKSMTVEGVALSLGFKSRSNFATVFKKITGLTPSEYRTIAKEDRG